MFNRPRCRDWTALATQQLRLRNLIQISGHNIVCDPKCSIYFTLHLTSMSAPFFTSEKIESYKNAIWPEINCQGIIKSTAHSVCVRVWQRTLQTVEGTETPVDKVLFIWGVYFSGLVPISKRTDVKLKENSLVFHIHGGFFTSTSCLEPESVYKQLQFIGVIDTKKSLNKNSKINCDELVLSSEQLTNLRGKGKDVSDVQISPRNGHHSPGNNSVISEMNPTNSDPESLKVRYIEKNFFKSEIRLSYNVDKLLLLQAKQRQLIQKSASAKELIEKICMRSAFCLNLELIANKAMMYRPRGNPSMGRTLNRLLFQKPEQPKPEILLQAQDLRRRIETAKFRCRLLVHERNQAKIKLRQLEQKLGTIRDSNIEQEAWLMANYRGLGREKDGEMKSIMNIRDQNEVLIKLVKELDERRHHLLRELKEIYCIQQNERGIFMINGAALPTLAPNCDTFIDMIPPLDISVALGYAAHITLMCSIVLNCPLRNPIIYRGSASRIRDNARQLHDHEREFPLYCRNSFLSEPLQYAIYLLNQNIAQMKFHLRLHKIDLRTTLSNLLDLLNGPPPSVMVDVLGAEAVPTSISESSDDLIVSIPIATKETGPVTERRVCRSVGSYTDEPIGNSKSNFSSEPILIAGPVQLSNFKNDSDI
ncbi:UV radiation resistance-associated gene protein [Pseudolycoriella hygida]|uniref:UV radiation resistance-associated gene protein n=1 Tax=Pseudolycoriella hygida TaxID=35572 RepID=A0A9Q0RTY9_9DIPT|nr:UV radiation resistance-associated gene protein [Pseudolycoriella hygida]